MEEKEIYEVISPSLNGYAYIHDFKTDNVLNTYDSCDLLNQQSKRLKELEQENQQLKQQLIEKEDQLKEELIEEKGLERALSACNRQNDEFADMIKKLVNEKEELKQQLAITEKALELACERVKYFEEMQDKEMGFYEFFGYDSDYDLKAIIEQYKQQAKEMLENE